ncbi:MAG: alpha/beta hydrolase [Acidimicrobiia bacterium]
MSSSNWFLVVSTWGALFTFNAFRPRTRWQVLAPSFFAQWVTLEMAPLHLLWQGVATALFIRAGALDHPAGFIGLAITIVSWIGLGSFVLLSLRSRQVVAHATKIAIGEEPDSWKGPHPIQIAAPLWLRDRKVERIKDIRYAPEAGSRHLLDIIRSKSTTTSEPKPVLLQIHGGAWMIGDKSQQGFPLMSEMAKRGWICVAINYRLSPKSLLPAHLIDCKLALAWIREHIAEYGGDPNFVAVTGGSAGGHLSAMVALTASNPVFQPGFEEADTRVQACVPIYGVYDFDLMFNAPSPKLQNVADRMTKIITGTTIHENPELFAELSPVTHVSSDAPPIFIVHGANDTLAPVEQAHHLLTLLRERSDEVVGYVELPGTSHAFEVFHSLRAHNVVQGIAAFLDSQYERYLENRDLPPSAQHAGPSNADGPI